MFCLITGASRGLGSSIARALGRDGHFVAVHYKTHRDEAERVAEGIGKSIVVRADVRSTQEIRGLVDDIIKRWGRIDLLVNNAGITREALLMKTSGELFDEIMDTNLNGPFRFLRAVSPHMIQQRGGHVVNIGSIVGIRGGTGLSAYAASKGGLGGLTIASAVELARYNIMVNLLLPGFMLTHMGRSSGGKAKKQFLKESLIPEYADPTRVADFICYLVGTRGVTGQVFNLDGRIL